VDNVVGALEQRRIGDGAEDVGALPRDLVRPRGRFGGGGDIFPLGLSRAAVDCG